MECGSYIGEEKVGEWTYHLGVWDNRKDTAFDMRKSDDGFQRSEQIVINTTKFFNILVPQRILDQHTVQYFTLVEKLPVSHNTAM